LGTGRQRHLRFLVVALRLYVLPEIRGHIPAAVVFNFAERGSVRVIAKMLLQFFPDHAFEHRLVWAARRYVERQRSGFELAWSIIVVVHLPRFGRGVSSLS
jgi:hypothetical protein